VLPPTVHETLLELATAVGSAAAAELSYEEALVALATVEHRRSVEALQDELAALYAHPPLDPAADNGHSRLEWELALDELELRLRTELECWHYPLDHPQGEGLLSDEEE
jgi:hypothetical protein